MRRGLAIIALVSSSGCDSILRLDPIKPVPVVVAYRKPITITNRTGMPLADEPVSVVLANDPDLMAHAQADGSDLAFDDGANALGYEVVEYAAGTLDAWVRVPQLASGTTTIYLTYGRTAPTRDPAAAWPDAYVGVWHQSGTGATSVDSTTHGHNLAAQSTVPATISGVSGDARAFDATMDQHLCGADTDGSLEFGMADSFTYSLWVNLDQKGGQFDIPLHKGGSDPGTAGFELQCPDGTWTAYISDGTQAIPCYPSTAQVRNRWVYVLMEVDRGAGEFRGYLDGGQLSNQPIPTNFRSLGGGDPFCLGAEGNGNYPFQGAIDEVRVMRGVPTDEQVSFENANLASRDQTIAVGAEEPVKATP